MTLIELLSILRARDINVWADGERLRYSAASGALTPDLREELVKHKTDLLAFLNEANRVRRVTHAPITKLPREGKLLPSINQRRLWFVDQLQPSAAFNCYQAFRIKGSLNIKALERSLNEIVRRHEALRTTFSAVDGEPFQVVVPTLELRLALVDLSGIVDATERENVTERRIEEEVERPYDLAKGPLFRSRLFCLDADEYLLLLTIHHIVSDGWSMGILVKELTVLYEAFRNENSSPLPELPIQYVDFAHWQSQCLQDEALQQELAYWKDRLKGVPEVIDLPTDRPRPAIQNYHGASESIVISKSLTADLKTLSKNNGATLFMTLLAAFQTLLYRYTGQEDLLLGTPIAGRRSIETENLIGLFINTLVLRTNLSGNPSFRELLRRVRETALGAYAHQDVPFEKLMEKLHLERSLSFSSLFQVMFVLQNTPRSELTLSGATVTPVTVQRETALFELFLSMVETDETLHGTLSYRTDLFDRTTIDRMIAHFKVLLHGIVADPERPIAALPLLNETEKHQLTDQWNDTAADYPSEACIHKLFEAQVERTPDATVVYFNEQQLTYRELNRQANQVAHYLQNLGVGAETQVGICMERSLDMLVVLLGVLKAGGAYIPLDPNLPAERLAFMLKDTNAAVLLTHQGLGESTRDAHTRLLVDESRLKVICLDVERHAIARESEENPYSDLSLENLAYVIYTSGSTGRPKGVAVTHRALHNFSASARVSFALTSGDRVLQFASISFDAAAEEIYPAIISGAGLVLRNDSILESVSSFLQYCAQWRVSVLDLPTAYWHEVTDQMAAQGLAAPECLRLVIIGGERAVPARLAQWRKTVSDRVRLLNTYGPTEATVVATKWESAQTDQIDGTAREIPIGRPIANAQIYILDSYLQPMPVGARGDLYIGGAGLARGYLNQTDFTADRFVPNPFSNKPGERLYQTGDLARYLPDGNIEFLGRKDNQVKIRGFRIELGEIEAVLAQHPRVKEGVVVARDEMPLKEGENRNAKIQRRTSDKRLIAYVVPKQELTIGQNELRNFLREKLPDYMIPAAFVLLHALPVTATGKVDRPAISLLVEGKQHEGMIAPRDELELQLTKIWERVLKKRPIGVTENFFELGGHSLLAVQLFSQIEKMTGKKLPVATLFRASTIEQLAEVMRQQDWSVPWKSLVAIQPGGSRQPFFCVHAHDGGVLFWRDLARHLGPDQPFYAIQPQGLDGKQPLHNRIEDMAAHYVSEIRRLQPEGPYFIGGHCVGGVIAFEMAQQLHSQGEKIGLVALFDSYAPKAERPQRRRPRLSQYGIKAIRICETVHLHLGNLSVLKWEEKLRYLKRKCNNAIYKLYMKLGSRWIPTARNRQNILKTSGQAVRKYKPRVYPGKLTLFRAKRLRRGLDHDDQMGWSKLAGEGLDVHLIPGYHAHIVLEPRVRLLAKDLLLCLDKAKEDSEKGDTQCERRHEECSVAMA